MTSSAPPVPAPARTGIIVTGLSGSATRAILRGGGRSFICALGHAGRKARKREGDGATPVGTWVARQVFYRPDRVLRPQTRLPVRPLGRRDGWCDDAADRNYNRPVRHPYPASAEHLWRQDHLYDIVVVLGYNERPRRRGRGSAIFMHVAAPDFKPTQGCIALRERDLRLLLQKLGRDARVRVLA
jgi:L,D-peptidoglycan transpeptidase YkuD (ErfK/YbiS/YcfS/YnhG family)